MGTSPQKKTWLCNAGKNAISILPDGSVNVCWDRKNENLGNIYNSGFQLRDHLVHCDLVHCACPLWTFDSNLHAIAQQRPPRQIPAWDVFAHWHITYACQMMCEYCIVTGPDRATDRRDKRTPAQNVPIDKMIEVIDSTDLTFRFSLMGGEPFLVPNIIEVCEKLTRKHYIGGNTNLCAVPKEFWTKIPHDRLTNFHISLHIHPMQRKHLTDEFVDAYKAMVDSGFDRFNITVVAHPKVIAEIDIHRERFAKEGIEFKLIPMIEGGGATGGKVYPESYTQDELAVIEKDWLANYFPKKNAQQEKVDITKFRPKSVLSDKNLILEDN